MSATIGSSSSSAQKEMVCHCQLPVRICTPKTKEHPGKKFRVCPNSLKPGKKWKYSECDEEPVQQSLDAEIVAIKEDVSDLKK
ncbi:hypothetical protein LXL04_031679 [Taraxacum kok-saghyz]